MDLPGLVYEADVKKAQKRPVPTDTTRTRSIGKIPIASPSVVHMRSAGPQPLDHRAPISRPVPGKGGITLICTFSDSSGTFYNVKLAESATREEMISTLCAKAKLPPLYDAYFEAAPLDWFAQKRPTIKYQFPRRDLSALDLSEPAMFLLGFDHTQPVWIETDGDCSGNPGPGGWGCIISQGDVKVEFHGRDPETTNNEMELQALAEALDFLPKDFKGYVVLETDSENCIKTMTGLGRRWQIDNYVNLRGNRVKNKALVDRIVNRLKTLHADYIHVDAHKGDQWNERADELARMGRDEAISWPQCSFDVIMPNAVTIPFRTRSVPPKASTSQVLDLLSHETNRISCLGGQNLRLKCQAGHWRLDCRKILPCS
jgi:ribonuclease HI